MLTKLWITATTLIITSCCFAQDYMIRNTLRLDETRAFVSLQYGRNSFGCGFITAAGIMEAQLPIEGVPLGMAKSGTKNVLFFYSESEKYTSPTKIVHAALIEVGKRKIIKDNIIYRNPGKNDIELTVIRDAVDNFISILVRNTDYNPGMGGFGGNAEVKRQKTTGMVNVTIDKTLIPKEKEIKSIAFDGDYIHACGGNNGNLFICTSIDGQLIAERFDSIGTLKGKIPVALSLKRKSRVQQVLQYDSLSTNCLNMAVAYLDEEKHDFVQLFRFDFNSMKSFSSEKVVLNKDYVRGLQDRSENKKLKNFSEIYNLRPVQILESGDKIILVKEINIEEMDKNVASHRKSGSIISVFTKDLKLLKENAIDKWCLLYLFNFPAITAFAKNENLYIVTTESRGLASFRTILYNMNLSTGEIVKTGEIEKEESGFNWVTMPGLIMWFRDRYVVPFTNGVDFFSLSLKTSLVTQKYK